MIVAVALRAMLHFAQGSGYASLPRKILLAV